jgi:hypothetical protein
MGPVGIAHERTTRKTYNSHTLILLYAPSVEEALSYFVYREDQLTAHCAHIEPRTSSFKVSYSRLCCAS